MDPTVGPGTFIGSLWEAGVFSRGVRFIGFDIDPELVSSSCRVLQSFGIEGEVKLADYLLQEVSKTDLIVMNPPYVRHEKIPADLKRLYRTSVGTRLGVKVDGRSNLFVYFLLKALSDLKLGGVLCAITYDGVINTTYGRRAFGVLKEHCEILALEPVKTPFDGVLIDATIILCRKVREQAGTGGPTFCGSLPQGFTELEELVHVRRGTPLINVKAFKADPSDSYYSWSSVLVRKGVKGYVVKKDHPERAYLFRPGETVPGEVIGWLKEHALKKASKHGLSTKGNKTLLSRIQKRPEGWYAHTHVTAPIIFNYYLRKRPRHIYNPFLYPVGENFYAVTPLDIPPEAAWVFLNTETFCRCLEEAARNQGNGLRKLQLYEYRKAVVPDWRLLPPEAVTTAERMARTVLDGVVQPEHAFQEADVYLRHLLGPVAGQRS
jgi:hypothetical protein